MSTTARLAVALAVIVSLACGGTGSAPDEPLPVDTAAPPEPVDAPPPPPADPATAALPAVPEAPEAPPSPLEALGEQSLDEAYAAVSEIAWEPYPGLLRGVEGTLAAGAGNAWDQAFLLLRALEAQGREARFARAELPDEAVQQLLARWSGAPADATFDPELVALARDHAWVEVQEGGEWVALDPTFGQPRGEPIVAPRATSEGPGKGRFHQLVFVIRLQTADGETITQGPFGGPTVRLDEPIALVAEASPLYEAEPAPARDPADEGPGGLAAPLGGGMRRGLSGGGRQAPAPAPAPELASDTADQGPVGTRWTWTVDFGPKPMSFSHQVLDADPDTAIVREWLEFAWTPPGGEPVASVRVLHEGTEPAPAWRRYDLVIPRGPVALEAIEAEAARLEPGAYETLHEALVAAEPSREALDAARSLVETAGDQVGPLVARLFAAQSDTLAARAADDFGVLLTHPAPRLFLVSTETAWTGDDSVDTTISLDLRMDRVGAHPRSGTPASATLAFQGARGMVESALEGALVSSLTGRPALTTVDIMAAAGRANVAVHLATPEQRSALDLGNVPDSERPRLVAALDAGRQVAFPARPVPVHGAKHFGWWEIDPATGDMVGVVEGGQHQAMVSYTVTLDRIALDDDMGFALGLLVGASGTQWLIAAKMLELNEITEQAKAEIRAMMGKMLCAACPQGKVSAGAKVSVGADCYEAFSAGVKGGVGGSIAFCDRYREGVECAMAVMLEGIENQTPGVSGSAGGTMEIPWDCD